MVGNLQIFRCRKLAAVNATNTPTAAIGTTYEALNDWIFVIIIPAAMGISILMNLYFIWKSVRHECVLRETSSD